VAKFGGSTIGVDGVFIPKIIDRIKQISKKTKVISVFSAPLIIYEEKAKSMTDVAMKVGRSYASSNPIEIEVLREFFGNS